MATSHEEFAATKGLEDNALLKALLADTTPGGAELVQMLVQLIKDGIAQSMTHFNTKFKELKIQLVQDGVNHAISQLEGKIDEVLRKLSTDEQVELHRLIKEATGTTDGKDGQTNNQEMLVPSAASSTMTLYDMVHPPHSNPCVVFGHEISGLQPGGFALSGFDRHGVAFDLCLREIARSDGEPSMTGLEITWSGNISRDRHRYVIWTGPTYLSLDNTNVFVADGRLSHTVLLQYEWNRPMYIRIVAV